MGPRRADETITGEVRTELESGDANRVRGGVRRTKSQEDNVDNYEFLIPHVRLLWPVWPQLPHILPLFFRIDLSGWLCCGDCGGDGDDDGGWGVDLGRGMWGWGQTKSLDSGLQNLRILSNKYHCLCSDRPDGVITSGSPAAEKESVVNSLTTNLISRTWHVITKLILENAKLTFWHACLLACPVRNLEPQSKF